jgi:hypothetical protein
MNHKQWDKLTPKAQRIKVAELCGWCNVYMESIGALKVLRGVLRKKRVVETGIVPDYLNDLNAMHDAESMFTGEQYNKYALLLLHDICVGKNAPLRATATQRAEAFVLTMGSEQRWQDDAEDGGEYFRESTKQGDK